MAESMMSTPNLEGGTSSSDLVTAWSLVVVSGTANSTTYISLPFTVSHLYFMNSANGGYIPYGADSIDLVSEGTHEIATVSSSLIRAYVTYQPAYNRIQYKLQSATVKLNYIAARA